MGRKAKRRERTRKIGKQSPVAPTPSYRENNKTRPPGVRRKSVVTITVTPGSEL